MYNKEIFQHVNISWYKEHLLKNFSYWLLLTNSEYCKIFKSEEHLQMAASKNVFMKRKKNYKITIPAFWEGNMLYIYQYVIWLAKKPPFLKKELLMAASYRKTFRFLVLNIVRFVRAPTLENICVWLLLKMCSWNWEKIKFIRSFNFTLKNQYQYSTSISETSENVCFYFMIGFPWSLYLQQYFFGVARNKH